jgi:hypothetical protein
MGVLIVVDPGRRELAHMMQVRAVKMVTCMQLEKKNWAAHFISSLIEPMQEKLWKGACLPAFLAQLNSRKVKIGVERNNSPEVRYLLKKYLMMIMATTALRQLMIT